jgi:circadian clock protein KaiB
MRRQHETRASRAGKTDEVGDIGDAPRYVLRLYVSGATPRSAEAIANLSEICEERLKGRYDLQVIDIYQQPELASERQIVAVPTLIKQLPLPLRRLVGDLSKEERVLVGLDLLPRPLAG